MDFMDLNKAFPKDSYSLPQIDPLVDAIVSYTLHSFMDAYLGYKRIRMHPGVEENTNFITDQGTYCYKLIPFGLKNAGVTYQ